MSRRRIADRMAEAAAGFIDALDDDQSKAACLPFDTAYRTDWAFFPREMAGDEYQGLPLSEMSMGQQRRAYLLLEAGLSWPAFAQVAAIMALELPLDALEGHRISHLRDPGRYWTSIFGDPASGGSWGWRYEGHHVSINCTIVDGEVVASTPLFLGANPAAVRRGGSVVMRPCALEEDAARTLLGMLDDEGKRLAVLHDEAPYDIVTHGLSPLPATAVPGTPTHPMRPIQSVLDRMDPAGREALRFDRDSPRGLPRAAMDADQRRTFDELLDVYLGRLPESLAADERARLEDAGIDDIHFAWAGPDRVGAAHYYRIHGPTLLIEYDNSQDDANHVHTVWRHPVRDFATDLLATHRARHHRR